MFKKSIKKSLGIEKKRQNVFRWKNSFQKSSTSHDL